MMVCPTKLNLIIMKHITHPYHSSVNVSLNGKIVSIEPVVSQVLFEELSNGHLVRHSDVHLLLHQEKLAALGERVAAAFVDSMQASSPSANLTEGLSDSEIISTIKSKYLQQPSELSAWMEHLKELAMAEVDKANAKKSQDETNEQISETNKQTSETN